MRVLIVEDDEKIAHNIGFLLKNQQFLVDHVSTVEEALIALSGDDYDVAVVDWMLPDGDGVTMIQTLRQESNTIPMLLLTAKSHIDDIVQGLDAGADDYLTKPFRSQELVARITSLSRRTHTQFTTPITQIGILTLNQNDRTVSVSGKPISLSPKEFTVLEYLVKRKNEPVDRLTLLNHVWGNEVDEFSNTVDVHIRYIRKKLGKAAEYIQTIKGIGYRLCEPNQ